MRLLGLSHYPLQLGAGFIQPSAEFSSSPFTSWGYSLVPEQSPQVELLQLILSAPSGFHSISSLTESLSSRCKSPLSPRAAQLVSTMATQSSTESQRDGANCWYSGSQLPGVSKQRHVWTFPFTLGFDFIRLSLQSCASCIRGPAAGYAPPRWTMIVLIAFTESLEEGH